ncbi:Putative phospholipase A1 precursor [Vibrio thalassae]|uniref:Phospholipase A1 n=1 Tax=Vibrio thalassae TaxID=1243014 RepID=A0A240EKW1_9VIBR|nr:phospholipase A [Vibrio thalassae]SNX48600.1 Putative phospholipase A1 precursor [Vibrio thalassae]
MKIKLLVVSILMTPLGAQATLDSHKDSYFLPYYHEDNVNQQRFAPLNPNGGDTKNTFIQFQISLKYPLISTDNSHLYLAYTQKSNWEAYDKSAYFRDNDFNPELFYIYSFSEQFDIAIGAEHQSNGTGGTDEVSWNRGYINAEYHFSYGTVGLKPWFRFDDTNDYNPDIVDYLGHGELTVVLFPNDILKMKGLARNVFKNPYYSLTLEFPIYQGLKGYAKYENGYGSTISNYDFKLQAYGLGLAFDL